MGVEAVADVARCCAILLWLVVVCGCVFCVEFVLC